MKTTNFLIKMLFCAIMGLIVDSIGILNGQTGSINNKPENSFIQGIKNGKVFTAQQANTGSEFNYSCGRNFKIKFFFEQVDLVFYAINENNQKQRLDTGFEVGYTSDAEMQSLKDSVKFQIGQYDFDADEIDELIVALEDNDESLSGLTLNIFKLENDKWKRIGILTGKAISGEPVADIKMNKITIKRNLRGFYYQWTFENGKFKDTGDY